MISFSFWQRWLLAIGIIITLFGVAMTILSGTPLFDLFNRQINPAFWGASPVGDAATQFQQWLYGVLGSDDRRLGNLCNLPRLVSIQQEGELGAELHRLWIDSLVHPGHLALSLPQGLFQCRLQRGPVHPCNSAGSFHTQGLLLAPAETRP